MVALYWPYICSSKFKGPWTGCAGYKGSQDTKDTKAVRIQRRSGYKGGQDTKAVRIQRQSGYKGSQSKRRDLKAVQWDIERRSLKR